MSRARRRGVDLRGQWRGHKADIWEGGHRVPFLVRWPGVVAPGSSCDEPIALTDVMATVAEALGVETKDGVGEDSASLVALLRGDEGAAPLHDAIVHHSSTGQFAIRAGRWKLCFCPGSGGWSQPKGAAKAKELGLPPVQLYDMREDPSEQRNLATAHPERVDQLILLLREVVARAPCDGEGWWARLPWPREGG